MDLFQLIILALIQGLTEFLPISSSAHLILPAQVLGWPDQGLVFDVAVHVGTLLAVLIYFRRDVVQLLLAWLQSLTGGGNAMTDEKRKQARTAWMIILATIPAALAGLLFEDVIEAQLRSVLIIAVTTIGFGLLLGWADKKHRGKKSLFSASLKEALVIGVAQALALIPGTSRSGVTMTAALLLGWDRQSAARFSFLLSIPLILAAGALKTIELIQSDAAAIWVDLAMAFAISFISAYLCIHFFLKFLEKIGFLPFVYYRIALGLILFAVLFIR